MKKQRSFLLTIVKSGKIERTEHTNKLLFLVTVRDLFLVEKVHLFYVKFLLRLLVVVESL